ncbi:MAG: hypothetical protein MI864_28705 [Pseudomonadales bacterium]|nr:hypothetical protein [Pseudomonadales bacterium]
MKFIHPYSAQGDVNIFDCNDIPAGLEKAPLHSDGRPIVGHSETGHMHVVDGNSVTVYQQDDFVSYLDVKKEVDIIHLRSFDTHKTITLPPGQYRITRQREYTPEGFRRAAD